ncbi:MAG TPA: agmatinase [Nitrospinota bacterium]|nr:agmatinase [Nitrospinota bacterium]|tara:strand:- start:47900 stop:48823 length:924 start_codon:yes stop_codon:yes gene_type:complete
MASEFGSFISSGGFGAVRSSGLKIKDSDVIIIPSPYDGATSYRSGANEGPQAIIAASSQVELYDAEWNLDYEGLKLYTLNPMEPDVTGPESMINKLQSVCETALQKCDFLLTLGGDHSLTSGPVRAYVKKFDKSLTVIQIDAHADLRKTWQGSPYSHACVMRRVSEVAKIAQIGIRSMSKEENAFIYSSGHPVCKIWDMAENTNWIDKFMDQLTDNVYITIDMDCFDPSVAPGVGTPEPGGLMWQEVCNIIRVIGESKNVVGADIMEVKPQPGSIVTEFTAAKLCYKIIAAAMLIDKKTCDSFSHHS